MAVNSLNSFNTKNTLKVDDKTYEIYKINSLPNINKLPYSLKVLVENLLRTEDGVNVTATHIDSLLNWDPQAEPNTEIQFTPARVIMQDFTGVPCIVDLATIREAVKTLGGDPKKINPLAPAEMVIDHSVIIEKYGHDLAFEQNVEIEYQRNEERYKFLRWGQTAFDNFRVVPPGTGIVHQVNIENLARTVMVSNGKAYPDTCVGTDSHTTMENGLGVLGWGVGGIEAEAAMLGQPISMLIPKVVGFKVIGSTKPGVTATDVVLTITEKLRNHGVVGKFVEFYGHGISEISLANRATIGNMSPEFGSTCAIFPIDEITIDYLKFTGREPHQIKLVEEYAKAQNLWHYRDQAEASYSEYITLDLGDVVPSIAGPKRPQDRINLSDAKSQFRKDIYDYVSNTSPISNGRPTYPTVVESANIGKMVLDHGFVAIASITSCTNTSNPSVMLGAALLAKKAVEKGLSSKPWVKTSIAPGSQVVTDYYNKAGLWPYLEKLGFYLVGYGCATCIGNSGPLIPEISKAIQANDLTATAVLSGNRNFEGRINPDVKMNYLASPPLVIAYAIAGTMDFNFKTEPLGIDSSGNPVYLEDIWPSNEEINAVIKNSINSEMYIKDYANVFQGDERWRNLNTPLGETFTWDPNSTYIRKAPYFDGMTITPTPVTDIINARVLVKLGDSVTTDHISPASTIKPGTPAAQYLDAHGVAPIDYNSLGARRGNHEVMVRSTFGNIRLQNQLLDNVSGGYTRDFTQPAGPKTFIYDAAQNYKMLNIPLVVLGGKEYGTGSSRDWAAKGTSLLGVRAVIAESFERIHRSNLIGMGVIPLQFPENESHKSLGLDGTEIFNIYGITKLNEQLIPETVTVTATKIDGTEIKFEAIVRIDTPGEANYYRHGGILQYVLRNLVKD